MRCKSIQVGARSSLFRMAMEILLGVVCVSESGYLLPSDLAASLQPASRLKSFKHRRLKCPLEDKWTLRCSCKRLPHMASGRQMGASDAYDSTEPLIVPHN